MREIKHKNVQQLTVELSLDNPEHPRNSNFPHMVRDNVVQCAQLPRILRRISKLRGLKHGFVGYAAIIGWSSQKLPLYLNVQMINKYLLMTLLQRELIDVVWGS